MLNHNLIDGRAYLLARVSGFSDFLRSNGFTIGVQEKLDMMSIMTGPLLMNKRRLAWALRSILCINSEQWHEFDDLFDVYWLKTGRRQTRIQNVVLKKGDQKTLLVLDDAAADKGASEKMATSASERDVDQVNDKTASDDGSEIGEGASIGGASAESTLATTDFRFLSDEAALRETEKLVEKIALRMKRYIVRRQRIQRQGRRIHLRKTIRSSLRYGGTPIELAFQKKKRKIPKLVLLLDVSRSMSLYSYFFLRFARGIVTAFRNADAFIYHTKLVHITEALRERNQINMREKLAVMSGGWAGGTKIGSCLEVFNKEYGRRIINSRTVVVIVSDGYDTGEPELLGQQLARIKQRAKKIIWLNPLIGREGYQPTAGGMQAAMPYIDLFAPAHNLASLQALESQIANV